MSRRLCGVLALVMACMTTVGSAQNRWAVELRGGVALPIEDFGPERPGTGAGFEGSVAWRFLPHVSVYGGWSWYRFGSEGVVANAEVDLEETGYGFGFRWEHPMGGGFAPLLRLQAGGTYNHVEIEDANGDLIDDSGHSLGWEAGVGLVIPFAGNWRVTPGVRIRSLSPEFEALPAVPSARLRYVALEVGFSRRF